jgi:hypothetical protein
MLRCKADTSASVCVALTYSIQFRGQRTGHFESISGRFPRPRQARLDHGQFFLLDSIAHVDRGEPADRHWLRQDTTGVGS